MYLKTHIKSPDRHITWPGMPRGRAWVSQAGLPIEVFTQADWLRHVCAEEKTRKWVKRQWTNAAGCVRTAWRRRDSIDADLVTTFPPFALMMGAELMYNKNPGKFTAWTENVAMRMWNFFEDYTGRDVVGITSHWDTWIPHFDIWSSRVGRNNYFIPGTNKWVGLVGPDAVALYRGVGFKTRPENDFTRARLQKIEREYLRRGQCPVDIALADIVDTECVELLTGSIFWDWGFEQYKAMTPIEKRNMLVRKRNAMCRIRDMRKEME